MKKVRLSFVIALVAVLAIAGSASAGTPEPSERTPGELANIALRELRELDIHRTGTPNLKLVSEFDAEYGPYVVLDMSPVVETVFVRADGYYWVILAEEGQDAIDEVVSRVQRVMGDDFPIAISLAPPFCDAPDRSGGPPIRLADIDWNKAAIYRTGNPSDEVFREFGGPRSADSVLGILENLTHAQGSPPLIISVGARPNGYFSVTMREEDWDAIYLTVGEVQQMMGDDFPIAVMIGGRQELLGDVFGGHRGVIHKGIPYSPQTLGFAARFGTEVGMVLSGHWIDKDGYGDYEVMPVGGRVYSPTTWYPLRKNQIGEIGHVGGLYSDSSYMTPRAGVDRIRPGVEHFGVHTPVLGWGNPVVGAPVWKTGITTGTTQGWAELYDWYWHIVHERYLWSVYTEFDAGHGDSGAPVYVAGPGYVLLCGIFFGQSPVVIDGEVVVMRVFSPMSHVTADLVVTPLLGPFDSGVQGVVYDSYTGYPLAAKVDVQEIPGCFTYALPSGTYEIQLPPGNYTLKASYPLFYDKSFSVQVVDGQFAQRNFALDPLYPGMPIPLGDPSAPQEVSTTP